MASPSPCAACKFLRRKCLPACVFAPYFPPDQTQKFANVHTVFGASNVAKLLVNKLQPHQRHDAVESLAYEAKMRLLDPVYGCAGVISRQDQQIRQQQMELSCTKSELSISQQQIRQLQMELSISQQQVITQQQVIDGDLPMNMSGGQLGGFQQSYFPHNY